MLEGASADGRRHHFPDRPKSRPAQRPPPRPAAHQRGEVVDPPTARAAEAPPALLGLAEHVARRIGVVVVGQRALDNPTAVGDLDPAERQKGGGRCDQLELVVGDDGVGGADVGRGTGLRGLAVRLDVIEGRLYVSPSPGAA
jgi:hypothetical protein